MSYYAKRFFGQQGIVTDGLKLWLDASNPASYPGSGTAWNDLSGNANNSTLNGTVYNSSSSGVMYFDGINDSAGLNATKLSSLINFRTRFTISLWYKTKYPLLNAFPRLIDIQGTDSILLGLDTTGGVSFIMYSGGNVTQHIVNATLPQSNDFRNITVVVNIPNIYLYVNGVLISTINNTIASSNNTKTLANIGNNTAGGTTRAFSGYINDILMYNTALIEVDVWNNFVATKTKYGL